jgi:diguanylate cyclase (GGDEF)-like protein/PAS domain S-box-containing protein
MVVDRSGTILYASSLLAAWTGDAAGSAAGSSLLTLLHYDDVPRFRQFLAEASAVTGISPEASVRLRKANGWRYIEVAATNLIDDPAVNGIVLNARDVTERKDLEELLSHQAFHDPLTDLANRALFLDRLGHALDRALRQGQMVGLLYIDIDNFKEVNDDLGHDNGDQLLIEIAARLQDAVRTVDTVARLGGDEFTVLIEDLTDLGAAIQCADRISKSLSQPFNLSDSEVQISASIGIAHSGTRRIGPEDLMRAADIALYRAKNLGKARYAVFERGMTAPIHERLALEQELRLAVERNELEIHFQPIVDLTNGFVRGVEALVRWRHPERGLLMPEEFVAISESSGLIIELAQMVLQESCRQVREWQLRDQVVPPLTLSVNLSTYQFRHPSIVQDISRVLSESGLSPQHLILEITESLIMGNSGQTVDVLNDLKDLGVRLFIDDFGTGYSSLSFLKRFPFDGLKIDRTFVSGIDRDAQNQRLVAAIIAAGLALELDVVAEGIESVGQLSQLRGLSCTDGQGHLFASPGPAADVGPLVRSRVLLPQVRVIRDQPRRPAS